MPFKSESQRRFMWMEHPDIAKKWADEFPGQKNLPKHAKKKSVKKEVDEHMGRLKKGLRSNG